VQRFSAGTSRRIFDTLDERVVRKGIRDHWYEATLDALVKRGEQLHVVDVGDRYLAEIDTPEDLARVDGELRARAGRARP
jgi:NDP-sugar pyrophosphorylase family protein